MICSSRKKKEGEGSYDAVLTKIDKTTLVELVPREAQKGAGQSRVAVVLWVYTLHKSQTINLHHLDSLLSPNMFFFIPFPCPSSI
ncbi:hypothetical protein L6452_41631 [Arctium lappa]|uniref:Uncharacterized protein n=1 Tax=Arctium lappa TaxID=4217 RepID=A0ACB8XQF6_ARCLA|nr:hypothetical protein L6452_41631 [Arctium lappa]